MIQNLKSPASDSCNRQRRFTAAPGAENISAINLPNGDRTTATEAMQPSTKNGRVMQGREKGGRGVHNSDHAMKLALVDGARHLVTHSSLPNDDDDEEGDQLFYGEKRRFVTMVQEEWGSSFYCGGHGCCCCCMGTQ